jgi:hypothetical protein
MIHVLRCISVFPDCKQSHVRYVTPIFLNTYIPDNSKDATQLRSRSALHGAVAVGAPSSVREWLHERGARREGADSPERRSFLSP